MPETNQNNMVPVPTLPTFNNLLGNAWVLYKKRLKTLIGIALIPFAGIIVFLMAIGLYAVVTAVFATNALFPILLIVSIVLLVCGIVALAYLLVWAQIAALYAIKDSQDSIGIVESYRRGHGKIIGFAWVVFLESLIVVSGYLLLAIPGVIFSIWFSFAAMIFLFENEKGMNALIKSREYVRNAWWPVMFRLWAMSGILIMVSWFFSGFNASLSAAHAGNVVLYGESFLARLVMFLLAPLQIIFNYLVYLSLKSAKGEFAFSPAVGQKTPFIVVGVIGIIVACALTVGAVYLASTMPEVLNRVVGSDEIQKTQTYNIQVKLDDYKNTNGAYPKSLDDISVNPADPSYDHPYNYWQTDNGSNYKLCTEHSSGDQVCYDSKPVMP